MIGRIGEALLNAPADSNRDHASFVATFDCTPHISERHLNARMTAKEASVHDFVEAMHATLLRGGHDSNERAMLLSLLGELPILANIKPTNIKLKNCILQHPAMFVLHENGSEALKVHAVRPAADGRSMAKSATLNVQAPGACKVRARGGSSVSLSERFAALVQTKTDNFVGTERLREPALLESAPHHLQPATNALPSRPSRSSQAAPEHSEKNVLLSEQFAGKALHATARSGCPATAGGGEPARLARDQLTSRQELSCKSAAKDSCATHSSDALITPTSDRAKTCHEVLPSSTNAAAKRAGSTSAAAHRLAAETERFKRCADHILQFRKANVNAHEISTDQALQVFLHFVKGDHLVKDSEFVVNALCNRDSFLHTCVRRLLNKTWRVDSKAECLECFVQLVPVLHLLQCASNLNTSLDFRYRSEVLPLLHDAQFVCHLRDVLVALSRNANDPNIVEAFAEMHLQCDWYRSWYPQSLQNVFQVAIKFFHMMSRYVSDACATLARFKVVDALEEIISHCSDDDELHSVLHFIYRIVYPDRPLPPVAAIPATSPLAVPRSILPIFGRRPTVLGPARFDGTPPADHFSTMAVIPSSRDVLSEEGHVYLPLTLDSHIKQNLVEAHLDRHFRWYRECMVAPFRMTMKAFLQTELNISKMPSFFKLSEADPAIVTSSISVCGMHFDERDGVLFDIQSDSPKDCKGKADFWFKGRGSDLYESQKLVCLCLNISNIRASLKLGHPNISDAHACDLIFLQIVDVHENRDDSWKCQCGYQVFNSKSTCPQCGTMQPAELKNPKPSKSASRVNSHSTVRFVDGSPQRFQIRVKCLSRKDFDSLIELTCGHFASFGKQPLNPLENFMLYFPRNFLASFSPILKSLQNASLLRFPMVGCIVNSFQTSEAPLYQRSHSFVFDLACVLKDASSVPHWVHNIRPATTAALKAALEQHRDAICFDDAQMHAFVGALTRRISLIQGPPGTGKSYVGVKVVHALLKMSPRLKSPILCICHTNHALDQFLLALLSSGCIKAEEMVRLGSQSKSEIMKSLEIASHPKFKERILQSKECSDQMRKARQNLERFVHEINSECGFFNRDLEHDDTSMCKTIYDFLQKNCGAVPNCQVFLNSLHKTSFIEQHSMSATPSLHAGGKRVMTSSHAKSAPLTEMNTSQKDDEFEGDFEDVSHKKKIPPSKELQQWVAGKLMPCSEDACIVSSAAIQRLLGDGGSIPCSVDVWALEKNTRLRLLKHIVNEAVYKRGLFGQHGDRVRYDEFVDSLNRARDMKKVQVLRNMLVIGMTTAGASRYRTMLEQIGSQVVLCEEAGEILEAHVISSLHASTEQLILIGDHFQLRPHVDVMRLKESAALGHSLDVSLFERLVRHAESVQLPPTELPSLLTLQTQRRMRPQIADLIRFPLYPKLLDHATVMEFPVLPGFVESLWFFDHRFPEQGGADDLSLKSYRNESEASLLIDVALYAIRNGIKVAIITPYVGQLLVLRELLKSKNLVLYMDERDQELLAEASDARPTSAQSAAVFMPGELKTTLKKCVRLATVDNFQGEEEQLVLVSTVRSNSQGNIGFLGEFNRVNVMFSRAKHGMIVFGNTAIVKYKTKQPSMYAQVISIMKSKGLVGPYIELCCQKHRDVIRCNSDDDIRRHHDGGCLSSCGSRLHCGHACPRLCHPDDADHTLYSCKEPCMRMLPCGHGPCPQICCEPCRCIRSVEITLNCGHSLKMLCHEFTSGLARRCEAKIEFTLPHCKHVIRLPCCELDELQEYLKSNRNGSGQLIASQIPGSIAKNLFGCKQQCAQDTLECGHSCSAACGACWRNHAEKWGLISESTKILSCDHVSSCSQSCQRRLFCKHACQGKCHDAANCPPCNQPCRTECIHSRCPLTCSRPCSLCAEDCVWSCDCPDDARSLAAPRTCPMPCGVPCTKLPCNRRCSRILPCGHRCPSVCGEICPDSHCVQCCSDNVRSQIVDLMENKTFADLDVDLTPVIVLSCGHFFTVETMDGVMGIDVFYRRDERGEFVELRDLKSIAFAELEELSCVCPNCRAPISQVRRYGRVNNAVIVRYAARKHARTCTEGLKKLIGTLQTLLTQTTGPELHNCVQECIAYCSFVAKTPILRCLELAQVATERRSKSAEASSHAFLDLAAVGNDESSVQALGLVCRMLAECAQCQLTTAGSKSTQMANEEQSKFILRINGTMLELREMCILHKLKSSWTKAVQMYVVAAKHLYGCGCHAARETLFSAASAHVTTLESGVLFEREQSDVVRALRKSLESMSITGDEIRMVMKAVGLGTHGSFGGHWFECKNGHPYAIGECGGAMQQSKCPECGEVIGGTNHSRDASNSVAHSMLQLAGMELGQDP